MHQIEEGRFAELSSTLVLPPVDDLRQAAFFLPYALLTTAPDSALAAKARNVGLLPSPLFCACICKLGRAAEKHIQSNKVAGMHPMCFLLKRMRMCV